jgi:hypothetical protein
MNAFDENNNVDETIVSDAFLTEESADWADFGDEDIVEVETGGASLMKLQEGLDCEAYMKDLAGRIPAGAALSSYIRKTVSYDRRQRRYVGTLSRGTDWASEWNRLQTITLTGRPVKNAKTGKVLRHLYEAIMTEVQVETGDVVNRYLVNVTGKNFRKDARDLDVLQDYLSATRENFVLPVDELTYDLEATKSLVRTLPRKKLEA